MSNIVDEYLVKLGTVVDSSGISRFQNALREMQQSVNVNAMAMAASFLKAQTEIVGAFAAIGGAALGLVDKVAMADQEYRLFAMHMYMSKDAARGLKIAMDALGQPLENLSWDPELRRRTSQLLKDQRAMAPNGDYEEQMHKIRDIRFELTRTEVAVKYLGMHVVQDFMKELGLGPDTLLAKLHNFNRWLTTSLPELSEKLVKWFLPIWRDIKEVFKHTASAMIDVGRAFSDVVGALTGDSAIKDADSDFDKFGATIQKISHIFTVFAETLTDVVDLLAKIISAIVHAGTLNFSAAWNDVKAMRKDINARTVGAGILLGTTILAPEALPEELDAVEGLEGEELATGLVKARKALPFYKRLPMNALNLAQKHPLTTFGLGANIGDAFNGTTGLTMDTASPELMQALWMAESSNSDTAQNPTSSAYGAGQLLDATARSLGVDKYDPAQNRAGSLALMNDALRRRHGDLAAAIADYHEGGPQMDKVLAQRATLSPGAIYDVRRTLSGMGYTGDVNAGGVTIHITQQPGENAEHVARRTADAVVDKQKQFQEFMAQRNQQAFDMGFH